MKTQPILERMIFLKPIRGSQLTPNNVQEECIRVPKVYDWVFDAITTDNGIELPREYAARVEEEVEAGRTPLEVTCEVPDVGGFFPLDSPDTVGTHYVRCLLELKEGKFQ